VQRLDDHTLIDLFGTRTLLCHGDSLCTDDHEFQRFRAQLRTEQWQREFLAKPLTERHRIAAELRDGSRDAMADKANALMDVSAQAVQDTLRGYQARQLIHGHTHRPAHHEHMIDGHSATRYVLSDWPQHPSMLIATAAGLRVETIGC
ncbi:MAG: UDP-2,3-diacylglucosamine diphosphatase, partial [Halofilum sp. (in: g-proteobacteria)]